MVIRNISNAPLTVITKGNQYSSIQAGQSKTVTGEIINKDSLYYKVSIDGQPLMKANTKSFVGYASQTVIKEPEVVVSVTKEEDIWQPEEPNMYSPTITEEYSSAPTITEEPIQEEVRSLEDLSREELIELAEELNIKTGRRSSKNIIADIKKLKGE